MVVVVVVGGFFHLPFFWDVFLSDKIFFGYHSGAQLLSRYLDKTRMTGQPIPPDDPSPSETKTNIWKIDGWKMTFPFEMVPFQETC